MKGQDDDYRKYFKYYWNNQQYSLPAGLGKVISKPHLFSLSNSLARFRQVHTLRNYEDAAQEF